MLNGRSRQTIKFLKWINKYPGWWHLICTPKDEHINLQMMKLLIEKLAEESFYEIIFVLLEVHKDEEFMDSLRESMFLQMLTAQWEAGNKDYFIKELISYFE